MTQAYILGISASYGKNSVSDLALKTALDDVTALGAKSEIIRLSKQPLRFYDPDDESADPVFDSYREKILQADALILATPDYHGGPTGSLKNFLDYFWKEFSGLLTGYICASHEKGLLPMEQLRTHMRQCYAWSLPYGVGLANTDCAPDLSAITNANVSNRLRMLAYDVVRYGPELRKLFNEDRKGEAHGFASRYKC